MVVTSHASWLERWRAHLVVACVSMSMLGLELIWTRLFSAEFFYTFAFLILSLAIMGLGLGAVLARMFPRLTSDRSLLILLTLTALAMLGGPPATFALDLAFATVISSWTMLAKLGAAIALLATGFTLAGITLAAMFRRAHADMPRLYMADLLGAGAGVVVAVGLMNLLGTPLAALVIILPATAAIGLWARRWGRLLAVIPVVAAAALASQGDSLYSTDRKEHGPVLYTHWDATSKLKIYDFGPEVHGINIDNLANTPVIAFDGDWEALAKDPIEFDIDVSNLIAQNPDCTFLSLGAGGGGDVLQALQAGATEIHAVEVNGHINELMTSGRLADFSGNIYADPRVRVATDDARAYVRRHRNRFDMIYSMSSNSFAALSSGAFALAENYLFTTEAFIDYWLALTDNGFMSMEHQFYMPRLVSALMQALTELGVEDPTAHFAVYRLPKLRRHLLLLSKQPLTDELRATAFGTPAADAPNALEQLFPAPPDEHNLISDIVTNGWRNEAATAPHDISPATDDRPFIGQLGLWRNFKWEKPDKLFGLEIQGFPLATILLLCVLLTVVVLVLPVTVLPYLRRGQPRLSPRAYGYFFLIGVAFMAVEVVLLQRYALFVGSTVAASTVILTTLLLTAGAGSRLSPHLPARTTFVALLGWLLLEALVIPSLLDQLIALPTTARILIAALLVAPLGLLMGMPFPRAARRVGELIDWGFAVNGVASVIGATGVLLVAMQWGFQVALLLAAICYAGAFALLSSKRGWNEAPELATTPVQPPHPETPASAT